MLPKGRFVPSSPDEYLTICPLCGREKFYWNVKKTVGICHRCKITVNGHNKFKELFKDELPSYTKFQTRSLHNPLDIYPADAYARPTSFLAERLVSPERIRKMGILYSPHTDKLYIEVTPVSPEYPPVLWERSLPRGKWISPPGVKKRNYVYGLNYIPPGRRRLVLVEGIFDVITPELEGYAVALLGTTLYPPLLAWLLFNNIDSVLLWLDPDEAGRTAEYEISRQLEYNGIRAEFLDPPPRVEPGDMGKRHYLIERAKKWVEK